MAITKGPNFVKYGNLGFSKMISVESAKEKSQNEASAGFRFGGANINKG